MLLERPTTYFYIMDMFMLSQLVIASPLISREALGSRGMGRDHSYCSRPNTLRIFGLVQGTKRPSDCALECPMAQWALGTQIFHEHPSAWEAFGT
jgi:hypothetical protein